MTLALLHCLLRSSALPPAFRSLSTDDTTQHAAHTLNSDTLKTEQDRKSLLLSTYRLSPRALVRVRSKPLDPYTSRLSNWSSTSALTRLLCEETYLEAGFPLRCFQWLSVPDLATQLCRWHDNWHTSGLSIPVLSY